MVSSRNTAKEERQRRPWLVSCGTDTPDAIRQSAPPRFRRSRYRGGGFRISGAFGTSLAATDGIALDLEIGAALPEGAKFEWLVQPRCQT